jgi:predicted dehydrogenase
VVPRRILIVGSGSMGLRHFEIAKRLYPEAEIFVYSESGRNLQFPITITTKEQIESFRPEITVIANQASRHMEFAIYLASLGSHLLIEKPISANLESMDELLRLQAENNVKILVGYNLRYLPSFRSIKSTLEQKIIGRVLDVRIEVGQSLESWRPNRDYRNSVSARKIDGGGVLRELSHEIDYLINLLGLPLWVQANIGKVSDYEIDVEDTAHLIFGMIDERGSRYLASLHLDFIRKDRKRVCTIIGSEGTLEWNLLNGSLSVISSDTLHRQVRPQNQESIGETYNTEWLDLIYSIKFNTQPESTLKNSINIIEIILASELSQEIGSKVHLRMRDEVNHV